MLSAVPDFTSKTKNMDNLTVNYRKFSRPILHFLLKHTGGDLEIAESVVQDTFISAFISFRAFRHKSSYFTWLCKISLNRLADYYRREIHYKSKIVAPSLEKFNTLVDPSLTPDERLSLEELCTSVNACLNILPEKYRQLLHMKYYQDLSAKEICFRLGLSPRKLEGRLYRARKSFARLYTTDYPDKIHL